QGNLLMYTNGMFVYNQQHQQMPNGFGLQGFGSTQAAIIVPQPGNDSIYYIFTTAQPNSAPMCYSVVNMNLNNGLGDVMLKNQVLQPVSSEQLNAVQMPGTPDYWVVTHDIGNNDYNLYMVTASGVDPYPFTTSIGPVIDFIPGSQNYNYVGQLKFS